MTGKRSNGNPGARTIEQPTPARASATGRRLPSLAHVIEVHGLLLLAILLVVFYSLRLPDTFPTALTAQSILSDKSTVALLSLAEVVVIAGGKFDLSIGYVLGISHILAVGLQVRSDLSWQLTALIVLLVGAAIGLVNGLLVQFAQIDSFIATLGTGTIVYSISIWYTGGQQVLGVLSSGFLAINGSKLFGIPIPAFYVLACTAIIWLAFEYLPIGRYLYAIGSNPRAAELVGIGINRYVIGSFIASGVIAAFAGVVLGSRLQVGQSNIGPEYLLPAFVGALLGATTIKPGRVNAWGTLIAVLILAIGISGIQQMGASFYVEPLFNGATLIVAVGLAGYAARRRLRARTT